MYIVSYISKTLSKHVGFDSGMPEICVS